MGKLIDFPQKGVGHKLEGRAKCFNCGNDWEALVDKPCEFECPQCHANKGYLLYCIDTEREPIWHCGCGCYIFFIKKDGFQCPACGDWQESMFD